MGERFRIVFKNHSFRKADILTAADGAKLRVTKVYRNRWWKKFLRWTGFKIPYNEGTIRVEKI